ncbi:MAG: zinc ribbon domain-containing protein [bacterium]|nr:zinc ribbon domain-containing protein [bacterium]
MNFFEDLSKTISDKGKEAVSKARELTDVLKLKAQLAGEKTKLNEIFQTLGQKYYEQCRENEVSEDFAEDFLAVKMAKDRIAALEKEIYNLEGCRTCPECGAKLSQEDVFCSKCGVKMPQKPSEDESIFSEEVGEDASAEEEQETAEEFATVQEKEGIEDSHVVKDDEKGSSEDAEDGSVTVEAEVVKEPCDAGGEEESSKKEA